MLSKHLNKNNLHHAYLIEGKKEEILPEISEFVSSLGIKKGNIDFSHIDLDSFKIDDARNLKSFATEKSFSIGKKIFIISVNNFLPEAQNSLLKMFEEPIENTHFFVIVPDTNSLIKTLISRFYLISARQDLAMETEDALKFIEMSLPNRISFIKKLLVEPEEGDDGDKIILLDSTRSKVLHFLNALEYTLHHKFMSKRHFDIGFFEHLLKVRKFLRMPGSSIKTLMESVALVIPEK